MQEDPSALSLVCPSCTRLWVSCRAFVCLLMWDVSRCCALPADVAPPLSGRRASARSSRPPPRVRVCFVPFMSLVVWYRDVCTPMAEDQQ